MADIVSARCFGCGHIIKVPAALGGKKARCPQCTNTITIPLPSDTHDDIVSDEQLTEVARDGDPINDDDEPIPEAREASTEEEPGEDPSSVRRRAGTAIRRMSGSSSGNLRAQGTGASRGSLPRQPAPAAPKSSTGLAVGVALGVLAVGGLIIAVTMGGGGAKPKVKPKAGVNAPQVAAPATTEASDESLRLRCLAYIEAVNRADPGKIVKFFPPEEEASALRDVNRLLEQKTVYSNYTFKKADAASGVVVFKHDWGEKTLLFKAVNGVWFVAEKPTP